MIRYSLKNYRTIINKNAFLAILIVLSQIAAILSVYISVGLINNSLKAKEEARFEQLLFVVDFYSEYDEESIPNDATIAPAWEDIKDSIFDLYSFLDEDVESFGIIGYGDNDNCELYAGIGKGMNTRMVGSRYSCYAGSEYKAGDIFTVDGVDFTVTSVGDRRPTIAINLDDYPATAKVSWFQIQLNDAISQERISQINDKIYELFGNIQSLDSPEPQTLLQIQIDNMFIFTSAFILLIAVANISVYFSFLFRKREKQTAIFKICGASSYKVFMINIIEMLGSYIVSLAVSVILFECLLPKLSVKYKGFALFDNKKYILIFAVTYFIVSAVVSAFLSYKYSSTLPVESYKRAQKGGV